MNIENEIHDIRLEEVEEKNTASSATMFSNNLELIKNVRIKLIAILGDVELTVDELFKLGAGSVVKLDTILNTPISLELEGNVVAKGKIVAADDNFGVQITSINSFN